MAVTKAVRVVRRWCGGVSCNNIHCIHYVTILYFIALRWCQIAERRDWQPECDTICSDQKVELG